MRTLLLGLILSVPAFAQYGYTIFSGAPQFPNGYSYCKVVTATAAMVSGSSDLTDYPLTVILTDTDLKTVANGGLVNNASGYDIGFYNDTTCSGLGTKMNWEQESYVAATGAIIFHLKIPTLIHTGGGTKVSMYYGGAYASFQSTATAAWNANYKAVWHLATTAESTSGGFTLTPVNSPSTGTGQINGDYTFTIASSQYMTNANAPVTAYPFTLDCWMKLASTTFADNDERICVGLGKSSSGISSSWVSYYKDPGQGAPTMRTVVLDDVDAIYNEYAPTSLDTNWHHIVGVFTNSTTQSLYFDGALRSPVSSIGTARTPTGLNLVSVGALDYNAGTLYGYFGGGLDEVKIMNTALGVDWILTEYRNQSAPGTYISAGARVTP